MKLNAQKRRERKLFNKRQKKLAKKHAPIFFILLSFPILFYIFEPVIIGHDNRYFFYIFFLPIIISFGLLIIYRYKSMLASYRYESDWIVRFIRIGLDFMTGIIVSFCSFGIATAIIWNIVNNYTAEKSPKQIMTFNIEEFKHSKYRSTIWFEFEGRSECVPTSYETIKKYGNLPPSSYNITLGLRKGLWNYYVVDSWIIVNKK